MYSKSQKSLLSASYDRIKKNLSYFCTSSFFIFLSMATQSIASILMATLLKFFCAVLSQSEKVLKMLWASSMPDTSAFSCLIVSYVTKVRAICIILCVLYVYMHICGCIYLTSKCSSRAW